MRTKPHRTILATLALMLAALIVPATSHAILPPGEGGTVLMAGRMIRDSGSTSLCRAMAYGRVDNKLVLFIADHCISYNGQTAYTNGSVRIGYFVKNSLWGDTDLGYVVLDAAWRPSSGLNLIYRGTVTGSDFFTITSQPTSSDGCPAYSAGQSPTVYHAQQDTFSTTKPYRTGAVTNYQEMNDGCKITLNLKSHNYLYGGTDSGSAFIRAADTTTLAGVGNSQTATGNIVFMPVYEGLTDLNNYYKTRGTLTGAWLCTSDSCPTR